MMEASGTCAQLVARVLGTSAEKLRYTYGHLDEGRLLETGLQVGSVW